MEIPKPKGALASALPALQRAVAARDCRAYVRLVPSTGRPQGVSPTAAPTAEECDNAKRVFAQLEGLRFGRSREFRTGGVADATIQAGNLYTTWVVDVDGRWKVASFSQPPSDPQVGTAPESQQTFDRAAEDWKTAAAKGDCNAMFRTTFLLSPFLQSPAVQSGGRPAFCRQVQEFRKTPDGLLKDLADDPGAELVKLGATLDVAFYGLRPKASRYRTLIFATQPTNAPPDVLAQHGRVGFSDVFPAEPENEGD